jgi:hemoglobin
MAEATVQAEISRKDIRTLVTLFYERVRRHPRLGPIFHRKISERSENWAPHLAKIENFWANVVRHERTYSGNPMQAHMAVSDIKTEDFAIWLDLFEQAARECLPPHKADRFNQSARRIGRSLAMGVERTRNSGPPSLAL